MKTFRLFPFALAIALSANALGEERRWEEGGSQDIGTTQYTGSSQYNSPAGYYQDRDRDQGANQQGYGNGVGYSPSTGVFDSQRAPASVPTLQPAPVAINPAPASRVIAGSAPSVASGEIRSDLAVNRLFRPHLISFVNAPPVVGPGPGPGPGPIVVVDNSGSSGNSGSGGSSSTSGSNGGSGSSSTTSPPTAFCPGGGVEYDIGTGPGQVNNPGYMAGDIICSYPAIGQNQVYRVPSGGGAPVMGATEYYLDSVPGLSAAAISTYGVGQAGGIDQINQYNPMYGGDPMINPYYGTTMQGSGINDLIRDGQVVGREVYITGGGIAGQTSSTEVAQQVYGVGTEISSNLATNTNAISRPNADGVLEVVAYEVYDSSGHQLYNTDAAGNVIWTNPN